MVAINVSQFLPMIVQLTQMCPKTVNDWRKASDRLGCQFNSKDVKNRYHCLPDQYRSTLLEFCYDVTRSLVEIGNCLELANSGSINFVDCKRSFAYGCPADRYYSDGIYNYSACLEINTEQKCFVAEAWCEKSKSEGTVPITVKDSIPQENGKDDGSPNIGFILFGIVLFVLVAFLIKSKRKDITEFVRSRILRQRQERELDNQPQQSSHESAQLLRTTYTPELDNQPQQSSHESAQLLRTTYTPEKVQESLTSPGKSSCTSFEISSRKGDDTPESKGPNMSEKLQESLTSPWKSSCASFETSSRKDKVQGLNSPGKSSCASFQTESRKDNTDSFADDVIGENDQMSLGDDTPESKGPNMSECQEARREIGKIDLEGSTTYSESSQKIVAAIDFGTTYSGYCFSSEQDYHSNPLRITSHPWCFSWQKVYSLKTPTTILLDKDKEFISFGYDAELEYAEMDEGDHRNFYYFQRFKMALTEQDCRKDLDIKIKDVIGQELSAVFVVGKAIKYLKDELLQQTNRKTLDNIYWVFTCPSIWNIEKQKVLKDAAIQAGIPEKNLIITEEASAVSYHLHHLPCYRQEGTNNMTFFTPGRKYLLLDAGGGTVDITVNQIQLDHTSKVLTKDGGAYGGTTVDKAFEKTLYDIVGLELMTAYIAKHPADYIEMMRNYEAVKRKNLSNQVGSVLLRIPITLTQMYENTHKQRIAEKIQQSDYVGKVVWEDDKFRMTKNFFISLFQVACDGIAQLIKKTLDKHEAEQTDIILMVGGFSESSVLQQFILDEFMQLEVIVLPEPGLAVLRGAVLYGHQPVFFHAGRTHRECTEKC